LNGGDGVTLGLLQVTAGGGGHFSVDLSAPDDAGHPSESLGDIIERFNLAAEASGTAVRAQINRAGNGLALVDDSMGSAALAVDDTPAALSLGLGDSAVRTPERIEGANLQLQYIAPARRLAELNNGSGVGTGTFVIHGASGSSVRIDVTSNQNTLGDLLDVINIRAAGTGIMAEFNDTGDGLVIRDASGGSQELRIVDEAGQVARSLRLLADARFRPTLVEDPQQPGQMIEVDEPFIEGRFESLVTVDSNDTVADVARKINAASAGVSAAIINDGSSEAPFHLSVVSATTGSAGHVVFDAGFTGLALHTLVGSRDAAVSFGGSDGADGLFIRSSTNTLAGVVEGVTVDLTGTSEDLVELTVESDVERLLQSMQSFVSAYNEVVERVGELSFFDGQTFEAGILRGDPVLRRIEARLQAVMNGLVDTGHPAIRRFADVGISFAPGGPREVDGVTVSAPRDGTIRFDENRFREVFASDPQAVLALFTNSSQEPVPGSNAAGVDAAGPGLGVLIQEVLDVLTRSGDGDLARRDAALQRQEQLFGQRARNIQTLLDARRARLQRQFVGLEEAIAALSSQQASLNTLQQYLLATRASEST
jgi:flagellar hook-associated protein 2